MATNTTSFVMNVTPPAPGLFGSAEVVTVVGNPTNAPSWTYPIVLNVTNLVGPIYNVSLEMRGYSNSSPIDLDALLVAPDQTAVMLTSGGGGTASVSGLDLAFDDSGMRDATGRTVGQRDLPALVLHEADFAELPCDPDNSTHNQYLPNADARLRSGDQLHGRMETVSKPTGIRHLRQIQWWHFS